MSGSRAKNDPKNIEGTGFHYGDPVIVDHCGESETHGRVYGIHRNGTHEDAKIDQIDVMIDHPGHKEHGRVVTFHMDDVEHDEDFRDELKKAAVASK